MRPVKAPPRNQLEKSPAGRKHEPPFKDREYAKAMSAKARAAKAEIDAKLQAAKAKYLTLAGQTPLEFLTAVYRNQLYEDYDVEVVDEARGIARVWPRLDPVTGELATKRIDVELERRIVAATAAAPYVHRKRPIGIDGGEGKPISLISMDHLAKLNDRELGTLLDILGRMGVGTEFAGEARTIDA